MKKKAPGVPLAAAPAPHAPGKPPQGRRVPPQRRGHPVAQAPSLPQPTRVPPPRAVATVPHPKRPRVVRDVHGGDLLDLFDTFPDLPRPRRPRVRARR